MALKMPPENLIKHTGKLHAVFVFMCSKGEERQSQREIQKISKEFICVKTSYIHTYNI